MSIVLIFAFLFFFFGLTMVFSGLHCHLCHAEGVCCSISHGITNSWLRPSFDVGRVPDPVGLRCVSVYD